MNSESQRGYTLYFSYGSNMFEPQFKERCPNSFVLCRAELANHRFVITTSGYASVVKEIGSIAHGLLCALAPADEAELDRREGVVNGDYRREECVVATELDYPVHVLVYIDNAQGEGKPNPGYLEKILAGALRHELPVEAIIEIASWDKH